jgi:hypothetical protein
MNDTHAPDTTPPTSHRKCPARKGRLLLQVEVARTPAWPASGGGRSARRERMDRGRAAGDYVCTMSCAGCESLQLRVEAGDTGDKDDELEPL